MQNSIPLTASAIALGLVVPALAASNSYDYKDFSNIEADRGVHVTVVAGEDYQVTATANRQRLLRRVEIRQVGDTLKISRRGSSIFLWGLADRYEVTVGLPTLDGIEASSGAEFDVSGRVTDELTVKASSGSDVDLDGLTPSDLSLRASSGAEITISGSCDQLSVRASSGSQVDAEDMVCATAEIRTSSGADVDAHVTDVLAVKASSGSDIDITGSPRVTREDMSSGGDLAMMR